MFILIKCLRRSCGYELMVTRCRGHELHVNHVIKHDRSYSWHCTLILNFHFKTQHCIFNHKAVVHNCYLCSKILSFSVVVLIAFRINLFKVMMKGTISQLLIQQITLPVYFYCIFSQMVKMYQLNMQIHRRRVHNCLVGLACLLV